MLKFLVIGVMLALTYGAISDTVPIWKFTSEDAPANRPTKPDVRYIIEDKMIGDLHTKVLMNTFSGEYVQIVTDLGGRIEDLVLQGSDGKRRSVLLTHNNSDAAIKENAWWKNAILLPYANRIDGVSHAHQHPGTALYSYLAVAIYSRHTVHCIYHHGVAF